MAEIWGAALVAVGTVGSAAYGAHQAGNAADAQAAGARNASGLTDRQFQQTRADNAPWTVTGGGAVNQLGRLFGLPTTTSAQFASQQPVTVGDATLPGGTKTIPLGGGRWQVIGADGKEIGTLVPGGSNGKFQPNGTPIAETPAPTATAGANPNPTGPDMSAFTASPGYQFRREQGTEGIVNAFGGGGGAFSGNALRTLNEFNSGLASQEFGNQVSQLSGIAGLGQQTQANTNAYGAQAAQSASRNALYAGDARASGIEDKANIVSDGINQLGTIAGYYSNRKKPQPYGGIGAGGYGTPPYAGYA